MIQVQQKASQWPSYSQYICSASVFLVDFLISGRVLKELYGNIWPIYLHLILVRRCAGSEGQHLIASSWVTMKTERLFGKMSICIDQGLKLGPNLESVAPSPEP